MIAGQPPPEAKTSYARRPPLPAAPRDGGTPSALDLIDEAAMRLRLAPVATLGIYYAGSLPFIFALLYFWTDMSRRADAADAATGAALGMALLFVGMKVAQAVFAARLRAQFGHRTALAWTPARLGRLALVQTLLQPSGLFLLSAPTLLPMVLTAGHDTLDRQLLALMTALVLSLPLGWVYAFYANVTALGDGDTASARAVCIRAARHAARNPRGNHLALSILGMLGMFAWLNLLIATLLLPQLVKMFTGQENVFTRSGLHIFNSTFFAVTFGLVYLALDPLVKTFYALRCFYADAQHTGEDLQSGLLALPAPSSDGLAATAGTAARAVALASWLALGLFLPAASAVAAADPSPVAAPTVAFGPPAPAPAAPNEVSAPALGRSIEDVFRRREFAWRAPRPPEKPEAAPPGSMARFFEGVKKWCSGAAAHLRRGWHAVRDWFHRWWNVREPSVEESGAGGLDPATLRLMVYALIALFVGMLSRRWSGAPGSAVAPGR